MIKYFAPIVLLIFLLTGCGKDHYFYTSHNFAEAGWTYADSLSYDFDIQDTAQHYDLFLTVRHSPDYDFENLYVKFTTTFPEDQKVFKGSNRKEQVTSLQLAHVDGSWLGSCSKKECAYEIPIQINALFPEAGKYNIQVQQYMRMDSLTDIKGIDFSIRVHQKK